MSHGDDVSFYESALFSKSAMANEDIWALDSVRSGASER